VVGRFWWQAVFEATIVAISTMNLILSLFGWIYIPYFAIRHLNFVYPDGLWHKRHYAIE